MPNVKTVQVGVWIFLQHRLCHTCNLLSCFHRQWQHLRNFLDTLTSRILLPQVYISAEIWSRQAACLFPSAFLHSQALAVNSWCNSLKQHIEHLSKGRDICSSCCSKGEEFIYFSHFFLFQKKSKYIKSPHRCDLIKYWALCNTKKRLHLKLLIFRHWCFQKNVPG